MKRFTPILVTLLALAGLALAACGAAPSVPAASGNQPPRTVSVSASGIAYATPDIATIQIGVQQDSPNAGAAIAAVTEQATAIVDAVKAIGVADADIQTSKYSVSPQTRYDDNGRPIDTVYVVNYTLSVTFRDLTQVGPGLTAVTDAGANTIYGITFGVQNPAAVLAQAREQAMAEARARAEQLAAGFNAELGEVYTITEYSDSQPIPVARYDAVEAPSFRALPIEGGQNSFSVEVSVTYTLR